MDLGPHAVTIWVCYAAVAIVLGAVAGWLALDGRRLVAELAALESRGIRRRSARVEPASPDSPAPPAQAPSNRQVTR